MPVVKLRELLEAGVHFGHQTRRWNPKMKRFIFTERNGIYILDLQMTMNGIENAYIFVRDLVAGGGTILFVATKKQMQEAVEEQANRSGMPYVNFRWLGGMLTNFRTIHDRIKRMRELDDMIETGRPLGFHEEGSSSSDARARQACSEPEWIERPQQGARRDLHPGHEEGRDRRARGPQAGDTDRRDPGHEL